MMSWEAVSCNVSVIVLLEITKLRRNIINFLLNILLNLIKKKNTTLDVIVTLFYWLVWQLRNSIHNPPWILDVMFVEAVHQNVQPIPLLEMAYQNEQNGYYLVLTYTGSPLISYYNSVWYSDVT